MISCRIHHNPAILYYNVYVSETLLQTKLHIPLLRSNLVPRPRLIERLNHGLQQGSKLTLVSTPAGYGKTTLLSGWVQQTECPATWLSLDQDDNDPYRFWAYVIVALHGMLAKIRDLGLSLLSVERIENKE